MRRWVIEHPPFKLLLRLSKEMGVELFLVGGFVRDRLLGKETQDVDLTLSHRALEAARIFADQTGGTFVLLREEGEMARVIVSGQIFDFALFRGADLETDLRNRDFTINALSLSLNQAFTPEGWVLFDPLHGIRDLEEKQLRMASPESFRQDPLRLLRAFRFSAQLGLTIESLTRQAIAHSASALTRSAPERIRYEWLLLLSQTAAFPAIFQMEETGLLEILFPEMTALRMIKQDRYHHLDVFQHSLQTFQFLENRMEGHIPLPDDLNSETIAYLQENRRPAYLKWAALLHDLGKATTEQEKDGHRIFYGHAEASLKKFEIISDRFRLGNQEKTFLRTMIGGHMRPFYLVQEDRQGTLTRRALNRFVRETSTDISGFFLLALADSQAARGPEKPKNMEDRIIQVWRRALAIREEWFKSPTKKTTLVSGKDLIELGLSPGPVFKILLSEIQEEQWEGRIQSKEEALTWLKKRIKAS